MLVAMALVASAAIAHPGHDNSAWSALLYHALWIAPAVVTLVLGVRFLLKKKQK